jgi:phage gpG-like protein
VLAGPYTASITLINKYSKMAAKDNKQKIQQFFAKLKADIQVKVPVIIAETAVESFKENFTSKSWNGAPWPKVKRPVKRGSMMVRTGALMASIRPVEVSMIRVAINAGSSKVPYARVHNEGEIINRAARSETFVRNRYTTGKKSKYFGGMGAFKKGTTAGRGLTFKAYSYSMPRRQFMGHSHQLNDRIIKRIKDSFLK